MEHGAKKTYTEGLMFSLSVVRQAFERIEELEKGKQISKKEAKDRTADIALIERLIKDELNNFNH